MNSIKGIQQYGAVKAAYERARKIISSENPNRKELSDVLGVLEANKEGVEVLKLEVQDYADVCNAAKRKAEPTRFDAHMKLVKIMQYKLEPPTASKAYLYEKIVVHEKLNMHTCGTYKLPEVVRRIILPFESYWILQNPLKEGDRIYVSPKNTKPEHIETIADGFKDYEKADALNGEWLVISAQRRIRAISSEQSRRILAYAEFRRGIIEGNYNDVKGLEILIENLLGISKMSIVSPSIPPEE